MENFYARSVFFVDWGKPTLVIKDLDGNELFFWLPEDELAKLASEMAERQPKA